MGVKPLYYAVTDEALVFASEIKSIVNSGYVEPRCRDEGVSSTSCSGTFRVSARCTGT